MNKNSTPVGKRLIMLTISYLFLSFVAQAKTVVNLNPIQFKSGFEVNKDSVISSYTYHTFNIAGNTTSADLFWVADSELQNDHYEVERSFDMNSFKTIGLVLGPVNSDGQLSQYGFRDDAKDIKNHDVVYYMLKQVDIEGKVIYGIVKTYKFEKQGNCS